MSKEDDKNKEEEEALKIAVIGSGGVGKSAM
jgi:GTPase SAR1 family protein